MAANWNFATDHSRGGILRSFSDRFKIGLSSVVAASSQGGGAPPRVLTARPSFAFSASMALAVEMIGRMASEKGVTLLNTRREFWPIRPHSLASKAARASSAGKASTRHGRLPCPQQSR